MTDQPDLTGADWFKSSYSNNAQNTCVEAAMVPGFVGIRDTKDPDGGTLVFSTAAWSGFLGHLKTGHHNHH